MSERKESLFFSCTLVSVCAALSPYRVMERVYLVNKYGLVSSPLKTKLHTEIGDGAMLWTNADRLKVSSSWEWPRTIHFISESTKRQKHKERRRTGEKHRQQQHWTIFIHLTVSRHHKLIFVHCDFCLFQSRKMLKDQQEYQHNQEQPIPLTAQSICKLH